MHSPAQSTAGRLDSLVPPASAEGSGVFLGIVMSFFSQTLWSSGKGYRSQHWS